MNRAFVGIDPGMSGVIAIIYPSYIETVTIATKDGDIDIEETIRKITHTQLDEFDAFIYIEKVWRPSKLVRIAGILEGILSVLVLDREMFRVAPSTWRREILGNKLATKDEAIKYCSEHFTDLSLLRTNKSRVPDHNFAEAILIAEYARRKHSVSEDER